MGTSARAAATAARRVTPTPATPGSSPASTRSRRRTTSASRTGAAAAAAASAVPPPPPGICATRSPRDAPRFVRLVPRWPSGHWGSRHPLEVWVAPREVHRIDSTIPTHITAGGAPGKGPPLHRLAPRGGPPATEMARPAWQGDSSRFCGCGGPLAHPCAPGNKSRGTIRDTRPTSLITANTRPPLDVCTVLYADGGGVTTHTSHRVMGRGGVRPSLLGVCALLPLPSAPLSLAGSAAGARTAVGAPLGAAHYTRAPRAAAAGSCVRSLPQGAASCPCRTVLPASPGQYCTRVPLSPPARQPRSRPRAPHPQHDHARSVLPVCA